MQRKVEEVLCGVEKSTNELMNELKRADDCFEFVQENVGEFESVSLVQKLEMLLEKYQKTRSEVIREAGLDITYGYQIFDGRKRPRREKLLQLAFGFPLTVEDANELLRAGGVSNLYVRCKREAICMYCLEQKMNLDECNLMLYKAGEETLTQ